MSNSIGFYVKAYGNWYRVAYYDFTTGGSHNIGWGQPCFDDCKFINEGNTDKIGYSITVTYGSNEKTVSIPAGESESFGPGCATNFYITFDQNQEPPCENIPDGSAVAVLIVERGNGQIQAFTQSIADFTVTNLYSGNFGYNPITGDRIRGIRFRSNGFSKGTISISEIWSDGVSRQWETVDIPEGKTNKYAENIHDALNWVDSGLSFALGGAGAALGITIPTYEIFESFSITGSFDPLPECLDDTIEAPAVPDSQFIAEYPHSPITWAPPIPPVEPVEPVIPIPPDKPEPPDVPIPPDKPEPPEKPVAPIPITPPISPIPPSPPENGCECEIYLASILNQLVQAIYDQTSSQIACNNQLVQSIYDHSSVIVDSANQITTVIKDQTDIQIELVDNIITSITDNTDNLVSSILDGFSIIDERIYDLENFLEFQIKFHASIIQDELERIRKKLHLEPCEPDYPEGQTITEVVKEFTNKYEAVDVVVEESIVDVGNNPDKLFTRIKRQW